jgi:hypothetical protein
MLSFVEDGLRVLSIRSTRFHEVPSLGVTVADSNLAKVLRFARIAIPVLDGRREFSFCANTLKNCVRGLPDVFEAFGKELRIAVVQLNVILGG